MHCSCADSIEKAIDSHCSEKVRVSRFLDHRQEVALRRRFDHIHLLLGLEERNYGKRRFLVVGDWAS
jgi:hypothetical protein